MIGRRTGVICGKCGDMVREIKWVQPCLELGVGDSVAFVERGCLCGWVPVSVDVVPAVNMRVVEQAYAIQQQFVEGVMRNPYERPA